MMSINNQCLRNNGTDKRMKAELTEKMCTKC